MSEIEFSNIEFKPKYEMTDESIAFAGKTLYRIRALKDFGEVCAGDLGGFIEVEENLNHEGNCWVAGDAKVFGNASVSENAIVIEKAIIQENAKISGSAIVGDSATVSGYAQVYDFAVVRGFSIIADYAKVHGRTFVNDYSEIYGSSEISDFAGVYEKAHISDKAKVCGSALIYGHVFISGDAVVGEQQMVCGKVVCKTNLLEDLEESIRIQTGLIPFDGKVIAYKQVCKDTLNSFYDPEFHYEIGKWAVVENPDETNASCGKGLHFSNANYWNVHEDILNSTFLIAEIKLEDIITVQYGKIRCRRAFILGKYNVKENSNEKS